MKTTKRATCTHGVELVLDAGHRCFECEQQARVIGLPADARMVTPDQAKLANDQAHEGMGAKASPSPTLSERIDTATANAKNGRGMREDSKKYKKGKKG